MATAVANALRAALQDAGVDPAEVGHINAHGVAIPEVDVAEAAGIRQVFPKGVPVTGLKGYFGNAGAGAGVQEIVASLLALRTGVIPRTLNCDKIDPACDIDVVIGGHRATQNRLFANVNVTRAGQASALVVRAS